MHSLTTSEPSRAESGMTPPSFLVALLAAAAGALAWGAVSYFTGYEVGYVAWAIGGVVGMAMARLGGRGMACASTAAVLTVAGIAGGKLLGTRFVLEKDLRQGCQATFTPELHAEFVSDAADFALLAVDAGEGELRRFMVEHLYTGADSPEEVQDEELQGFLAVNAPNLRALHANPIPYAEWYAQREAESRQAFEEDFSIVQANLDGLDLIDLVFVVLGVSTAFGIVRRADAQVAEPAAEGVPTADEQEVRKAA